MLCILSPAKTQIYDDALACGQESSILFPKETQSLVAALSALPKSKLAKVLEVSPKLTTLNYTRYQDFSKNFTRMNSRQAILAYRGDVYEGFAAHELNEKDFSFAQKRIRIISGLYGVLRPLDRIQPYRLEMANTLSMEGKKDLYAFWKEKITQCLAKELAAQKNKYLINLASKEYFSAVDFDAQPCPVITCEFKEKKAGKLRVLGLFAKKARGQMARYIVDERIDTPEALKGFRAGNYRFDAKLSSTTNFVFTRPQP